MKKVFMLLMVAVAANTTMAQTSPPIEEPLTSKKDTCRLPWQERTFDWGHLDTLIVHGAIVTGYPKTQCSGQQAGQDGSGDDRLTAAYYLTALDYACNSKEARETVLVRYSLLARKVQGGDRAEAYAFLNQTHSNYPDTQ